MKTYNVAVASDHAGYELKAFVVEYLAAKGYGVRDLGTHGPQSVDYPDFGHALAIEVAAGLCDLGVALCGTANGITMSINRHRGVRAAICWKPEIAQLARAHNDANVCSLPARMISQQEAAAILDAFFATDFEGGRHVRRVEKIELQD